MSRHGQGQEVGVRLRSQGSTDPSQPENFFLSSLVFITSLPSSLVPVTSYLLPLWSHCNSGQPYSLDLPVLG